MPRRNVPRVASASKKRLAYPALERLHDDLCFVPSVITSGPGESKQYFVASWKNLRRLQKFIFLCRNHSFWFSAPCRHADDPLRPLPDEDAVPRIPGRTKWIVHIGDLHAGAAGDCNLLQFSFRPSIKADPVTVGREKWRVDVLHRARNGFGFQVRRRLQIK